MAGPRGEDILRGRLQRQQLLEPTLTSVAEVVRQLGAVQAQDYGGARWAVAQRGRGISGAAVDRALAAGEILRTHLLRPTWHLVAAADLRWILALTAPRVKSLSAYGNRQSGLDAETIGKSNRALATALTGRQLTRVEMAAALHSAGVEPRDAVALGRLLLAAELDGVICSGGLRGRQHTHALMDERVPAAPQLDRDAAISELARRYFAGHGPATSKDFSWWSGLSITDAANGARTSKPALHTVDVDGTIYWFAGATPGQALEARAGAQLLPNFDEYTVGYSDRALLVEAGATWAAPEVILSNVVVLDGRVAGVWKRSVGARTVRVSITMFRRANDRERSAISQAGERFAAFLGVALELEPAYDSAPRRDARSMTNR